MEASVRSCVLFRNEYLFKNYSRVIFPVPTELFKLQNGAWTEGTANSLLKHWIDHVHKN